jgi:dsDNA-specific endonuclease/ATPase MutS2
VLREAPTYLLCELVLDAESLAALAARDDAAAEVARREEAVRARLSAVIAASAGALAGACAALGELDILAARAIFAAREGGVVPELGGRSVALRGARLPPLAERLEARGRRYEPVSLDLEGPAVVTGPNMGGKTAALRTLGFAAACAILGVPVPARAARLPLFAEVVWLGVAGDRVGDDADLLSAFGAEVVEVRSALASTAAAGARPVLVLLDEFARTTSPREGRALLVAVLAELRERGAIGLAATHFAGVARAAGVAHFTTGRVKAPAGATGLSTGAAPASLGAALAGIATAMDYALEPAGDGPDGDSGALVLAAALGLDPRVLARAEAALAEGA